jgi:hypothetical protein
MPAIEAAEAKLTPLKNVPQNTYMTFPTASDVEKADREQLGRWYRSLVADSPTQRKILDRIAERFEKMGGMDAALSKKIGY